MHNIKKLINCMESKFVAEDENDLVFKSKFKDVMNNAELVEDCNNPFYVEYEDLSMYWYAVGKFNISIMDNENNKIKMYEIVLKYGYPECDDYRDDLSDLPTTPMLVISYGCL